MKVPLFKIYWDQEDIDSVTNVIKRGSYWATGPEIDEFEELVANHVGTKYAVSFNSGTSALYSLLLSYDMGPGDEVIVPSFTFIATANPVIAVGATPVFAEIEDKTYGLDPEDVKRKITEKTKAIMPIHYGGCPAFYTKKLKELAEENDLLFLEDAAQSLGAKMEENNVGSFGDGAMFSLCQNKVITAGEGGIITTDSKEIRDKLRLIRSHGRVSKDNYFYSSDGIDYINLGHNFRMPTLSAALGLSQMKKIEKTTSMRRKNAEYYTDALEEIDNIIPPKVPKDFFHVYQMYTIQVEGGLRDDLKEFLSNKNIFTKVYFEPIHLTKFYREKLGTKEGDLPKTEEISKKVLTIPFYAEISKDEMDYVINSIKEFMKSRE